MCSKEQTPVVTQGYGPFCRLAPITGYGDEFVEDRRTSERGDYVKNITAYYRRLLIPGEGKKRPWDRVRFSLCPIPEKHPQDRTEYLPVNGRFRRCPSVEYTQINGRITGKPIGVFPGRVSYKCRIHTGDGLCFTLPMVLSPDFP
jgi:hypothetical protein